MRWARASLSTELRTRLRHVAHEHPIPHDKVGKMTEFGHKASSEGHRHPEQRASSPLSEDETNVGLTRVNSQSHCRAPRLAHHRRR